MIAHYFMLYPGLGLLSAQSFAYSPLLCMGSLVCIGDSKSQLGVNECFNVHDALLRAGLLFRVECYLKPGVKGIGSGSPMTLTRIKCQLR